MSNPNDYIKQKERALQRKIELIKMKGSKCEICGYDKNISALEFHHIDPSNKSFQLDSRHLSNTAFNKILEEANKCILVCANCHREIHYKKLNKDNINDLLKEISSKHISPSVKHKISICKYCGKEFKYVKGKIYCCDECKEADKHYPEYNEIIDKYSELKSWKKVAKYYGITRKIIQRLRKINQ